MTDLPSHRSARHLGAEHQLTAQEMNYLLVLEGHLEGEPGAYRVTPKGAAHARETDHHRGTGGYPTYNRYWEQRTWDPKVTEGMDLSDERKREIREAVREARRLKAAARAAEAVSPAPVSDSTDSGDGSVSPALVVAVAAALTAVSIYGLKKAAPHLKALWDEKAAPRLARPKDDPPADDDPDVVADGDGPEEPR